MAYLVKGNQAGNSLCCTCRHASLTVCDFYRAAAAGLDGILDIFGVRYSRQLIGGRYLYVVHDCPGFDVADLVQGSIVNYVGRGMGCQQRY